jgi:5-formyltetrahydrofolate cyclo-ligase
MNEKADFRRSMKQKLLALDAETFKTQGFEAGKRMILSSVWRESRTVLLFMSMKQEIDTHFLLEEALFSGKNLFVPRIMNDDMSFFRIDSLETRWNKGVFGILEPEMNHHNEFIFDKIDFPLLVVVPGLAFDQNGCRIGRGKGYYDRFLSKLKEFSRNNQQNSVTIGFCLQEQLVNYVPTEDFDQKVDVICTGNDYIDICSKLG